MGSLSQATDAQWLAEHDIKKLVHCLPRSKDSKVSKESLPPGLIEWPISLEWGPSGLSLLRQFFKRLDTTFREIASYRGNLLIYCRSGRRAACITACWLMWSFKHKEDPDQVMLLRLRN